MATISLSVPTTTVTGRQDPGGSCYLIFPEPSITVRDLIAEKVRAEMRKIRAGGACSSNLHLLTGAKDRWTNPGPLDEQLAIAQVTRRFLAGTMLLVIDGHAPNDLDECITLTRRTGIVFMPGIEANTTTTRQV